MNKPRMLIVQPVFSPVGGGNAVTAWAIEALRQDYRITLACAGPLDLAAINRTFGTSLQSSDFEFCDCPPSYRWLKRLVPTRGALLEGCVTMRWAQNLVRQRSFDILFSVANEFDFNRRGLQYVHYPFLYLPRPMEEMRWFHRLPGFLSAYRGFCFLLARATHSGLCRNLTLTNSEFVAGRYKSWYQADSRVLPPPVPYDPIDCAWADRRMAVLCLGRIHHIKRWHWAVRALDLVREAGHPLELTLIGHPDDVPYARMLEQLAADRPWFQLRYNVSRPELIAEAARHRFGFHAMNEEHFGIAPAELQRAGCITFVHRSGGPMEIVGKRPELMFDTPEEAAAKICAVLEDPGLEASLQAHVESRREVYSAEKFCRSLREIVQEFEAETILRPPVY